MAFQRAKGGNLGTNQLLTAGLGGSPRYLGTIVSTTAKNNSDTAVPFVILAGSLVLLEASADVQYAGQETSTAATTTTTGVKITVALNPHAVLFLTGDQAYVSCVGAASTKVWAID